MSACSCGWENDGIGSRLSKPQVARRATHGAHSFKAGQPYMCPICDHRVAPGQMCRDLAGLDDSGGGYFYRMHALCYDLMMRFRREVCRNPYDWDESWYVPWPIHEASGHAVASGDDPYWREWLLDYEKTWEFGEAER